MVSIQKYISGLTENFDDVKIHKKYLYGLEHDEFIAGLYSLDETFKSLYIGMKNEPQKYAMKSADDIKGFAKNTNFLLLLAQNGKLKSGSFEVDGEMFAAALKNAKVTKPEVYFKFIEPLGFTIDGLGKKIETSEKITVEFPDNKNLLIVLKAIADAVGMFSKMDSNNGNIYFQLIEYRVLESYPAIEPELTMEYIISKLKNESRELAKMFYDFIKPLAKCRINGNIIWYWTPTFTLNVAKKVVMSFKIDLENFDIKLNLFNINNYIELLNGFPEKMINEIKDGGWECHNCNPKCNGSYVFTLSGKNYKKCQCSAFIFRNPTKKDSKLLIGLLKKELETLGLD